MKRVGGLMEAVVDPENMRIAYYRAQRGKEDRPGVRAFSAHLQDNLSSVREALLSGACSFGDYHYFKVYDKKERTICAAAFRERVAHHALMRVCDPVFERVQIADSYASRRGKGTFAALDRAQAFTRNYAWFLKLDARKYFDSIDHEILKRQLKRLFKDATVLRLLDAVIDSYETEPGRGVPIGNLTSQYFANHYLSIADHFVKERLRVPGYVRYMDDMLLWSHDKTRLLTVGKALQAFLDTELALSLKPFCLNRSARGLPCLGFLVFPKTIRLDARSRKRYRRKLAAAYGELVDGDIDQHDFSPRIAALVAHTEHADSVGFRRQVLHSFGYRPRARTA